MMQANRDLMMGLGVGMPAEFERKLAEAQRDVVKEIVQHQSADGKQTKAVTGETTFTDTRYVARIIGDQVIAPKLPHETREAWRARKRKILKAHRKDMAKA